MSSGFKKSLIAVTISGLMASSAAYATNGMFGHGYSTKEKGLAGAGVAYSQDSLAAATNPAGMVHVGARFDVGAALFNPNRNYDVTGGPSNACSATGCSFSIGPQAIDSDRTMFFIPHLGYNMMLDSSSSAGVSVYGNGGMNSNYKGGNATYFDSVQSNTFVTVPGTFGGAVNGANGNAGVDLGQLFIAGTYSKKVNKDHSVGASLIFAYQMFKADGLGSLGAFSSNPGKLSNNGDDTSTGFGAKLGWQGKVASDVTLGASYQTKMSMSEFDDYAGLFAEQGGFDIPATLILGAAWNINDKSKLVVDIQSIYYSDVASLGNTISPLTNGSCMPNPMTGGAGTGCLGGSDGAGFGWEDMTVVKVGYEWMMDENTMRAGISQGGQPIPDSEVLFNILAPGVIETHLTFGMTIPLGSSAEFSFAAMHGLSSDVSGSSPFDGAQTITLEMDQFEVQGTYTMKF